jgi:hypothetical protein
MLTPWRIIWERGSLRGKTRVKCIKGIMVCLGKKGVNMAYSPHCRNFNIENIEGMINRPLCLEHYI